MAVQSTWFYLQNPFDNTTKQSFKKMNLIATDLHDKLFNNLTDPFIADLYNNYFLAPYQDFKEV